MEIFNCEYCDYKTLRKSSFDKHLLTNKHLIMSQNDFKTNNLLCGVCDKLFKSRVGLWKHSKKCNDKVLINSLLQDNAEFKKIISQILENGVTTYNTTNNMTQNTTNSNNKHFNLNFFLNETCKDAMNIDDFVSSIKVNIEDLEHTGRRGYVEGISSIFIKNLNNLEHHLRPLHCSDSKREVLYIKNNNEWVKEKDDKPILTHAIKTIANENIKQIPIWKNLNPGCTLSDSKKNNTYLKILSNSMCGITQEETVNNVHKIISNISKEVFIDKKHYFI